MNQIILDPMTILGMSTYYEKKVPRKIGATLGLLYAQQVELKYRISVSAPIGTFDDTSKDILAKIFEYEALRLKRSKNTVNFYEEYNLVGWYVMGTAKYTDMDYRKEEKLAVSKQLIKRAAPYFLIVDSSGVNHPKLFLEGEPCDYMTEMQPTQKICIDSLYMQTSKDMTILQKTVEKSRNVIQVFSEKVDKLRKLLKTELNPQKRRQIMEILDNYERLEHQNKKKKEKTIEAMNYSILSGIVLDRTVKG